MDSKTRAHIAALITYRYVLVEDFGKRDDDDIVQEVDADIWALRNGFPPVCIGMTYHELVKMLLANRSKKAERAFVLLLAAKQLAIECDAFVTSEA